MNKRILRLKDVKAMTGLSRSTIYAEIAKATAKPRDADIRPQTGILPDGE